MERGCRYHKFDQAETRNLFPSENACLFSENPDACSITLNEKNYGNYGKLEAFYYTDSVQSQDFPTNTRLPPDLKWSTETGKIIKIIIQILNCNIYKPIQNYHLCLVSNVFRRRFLTNYQICNENKSEGCEFVNFSCIMLDILFYEGFSDLASIYFSSTVYNNLVYKIGCSFGI